MDSVNAFAMGAANAHKELMVFDWELAAAWILASGVDHAEAGLSRDWNWTGGTIFEAGKPTKDHYTYLASTWATPEIDLGDGPIPCFRMQSDTPKWDSATKWPPEAMDILDGALR